MFGKKLNTVKVSLLERFTDRTKKKGTFFLNAVMTFWLHL